MSDNNKVEQMKKEDWLKLGESLYGADKKKWKFKCIRCGNIQSAQDFIDRKINPDGYVHFSCLGRFDKLLCCDWTLGGLLQIHKREVICEDGSIGPVFLFADEI